MGVGTKEEQLARVREIQTLQSKYKVKERLARLGKTQAWMIKQLAAHELYVGTSELSTILGGLSVYPKTLTVLHACNDILSEHEG